MPDIADIDETDFPASAARAHPISTDEVARAFEELNIAPPRGARDHLHLIISRFVEEGIVRASGAQSVRERVREGARAVASGSENGLSDGAASYVLDSVVLASLPPPDVRRVASLVQHMANVRAVAERVATASAPERGRPVDEPLHRLICAAAELVQASGATLEISSNAHLDGGGEPSPFLRFLQEIILTACDRAQRVLDCRPQHCGEGECCEYFRRTADMAMARGSARPLASVVRRALKRQDALLEDGKFV